jgi:Tfp pilus assembly protein PilF
MQEALTWYQQQGNFGEAARVAVNLADALVNAAEPQFTAGRLLLRAEQPARGEHYLRRAIALDAAQAGFRLSLAQSQYMQGRIEDSIATLEGVLAEHPDDERAKFWLGEMRREAAAKR